MTNNTNAQSSGWTPEGIRKLVMTVTTVLIFGGLLIAWMITTPPGLGFVTLATAAAGGLSSLLGIGVSGNVLEHRYKSKMDAVLDEPEPPAPPAPSPLSTMIALPFVLMLLVGLAGCGSGAVNIGDLVPEAQIGKSPEGCVEVVVRQSLPAPDGWRLDTEVKAAQMCAEEEDQGRD